MNQKGKLTLRDKANYRGLLLTGRKLRMICGKLFPATTVSLTLVL